MIFAKRLLVWQLLNRLYQYKNYLPLPINTMQKNKVLFFLALLITGCSTEKEIPKVTYNQFTHNRVIEYYNDTLTFKIENPLLCPLRVSIASNETNLLRLIKQFDTITLRERSDTIIKFYSPQNKKVNIQFHTAFGDVKKNIIKKEIELPFPKNKEYRIIQGYNGSYSHNSEYSRYALDFDLKVGDTVCSAENGYVVGVIKDYKFGGSNDEWKKKDKSNFITIYHPESGLFTQYVHLKYDGSFVKVGDKVYKGQPIGLSGRTGYTNIEHLHFNVLLPKSGKTLVSTQIKFENGIEGQKLTTGMLVKNK